MRLTTKLSLAISCLLAAVLVVHSAFTVRRQRDLFTRETSEEERNLGRVLGLCLGRVADLGGAEAARALLGDLETLGSGPTIRWQAAAELAPDVRAELAEGHQVTRSLREDAGREEIRTYVPARFLGDPPGAVVIRESLASRDEFVRGTLSWVALGVVVFGALGGALSHWLGRRLVGEPVEALIRLARRIGGGDFGSLAVVARDDELTELAREMNAMSRELEETRARLAAEEEARARTEAQLRHADRLSTVGVLAAGLAHEIGTPLNVITGRGSLIEGAGDLEAAKRSAAVIVAEARRITGIIRKLLDFARRAPPTSGRVVLGDLVGRTLELVADLPLARGKVLEVAAEGPAVACRADGVQLQQVFTNIVTNALHASPAGGTVRVEVGVRDATPPPDLGDAPGRFAAVRVCDEGAGIDEEALPRVFEPFFTTKEPGEGTGLGLAVSYGIVRDHGGWIEVENQPGSGACFTIFLPLGEEG